MTNATPAKLRSLTTTHARGLYREKLDARLAPRTVNYIHTTPSKALKDAVADGLIPRNVTEGVKAPGPKKKEVNPLTAEQAGCLLEAARGERFEALYAVVITAGLREGELLGLKWEDVDLEGGKLSVRRTLSVTKERGHIFKPPKNGKGRNVKLSARAIGALKRHKAAQNAERLRVGTLWQNNELVFPSQRGTTMSAKNLTARSSNRSSNALVSPTLCAYTTSDILAQLCCSARVFTLSWCKSFSGTLTSPSP